MNNFEKPLNDLAKAIVDEQLSLYKNKTSDAVFGTKKSTLLSKHLLRSLVKSPLRYPGGKNRAVKKLSPLIPIFSEYREPFVGGASIYLYLKQMFPEKKFWVNDLNNDVYCLWSELKKNSINLIEGIQNIKDSERDGRHLYKRLLNLSNEATSLQRAIRFFVMNRITFSGTADSGGYSENSFQERFTQSSIERLKAAAPIFNNTTITNIDYEELVTQPGQDVFIFLDPPYLTATKSKLYGKKGDLHLSFDHQRFAEVMKGVKHKWMITYDDCPEIKDLFSFANIIDWKLQYGMNNYKQVKAKIGKELIITNYL